MIKEIDGRALSNFTHLENAPSGEKIDSPLNFAIVDVDQDDVMTTENESSIHIKALDEGSHISGQSTISLTNGQGSFTETIFTAEPGKTGVRFLMTSTAINYAMLKHMNSATYADQIFTVDFRWCMPGEIQIGTICSE